MTKKHSLKSGKETAEIVIQDSEGKNKIIVEKMKHHYPVNKGERKE